MSASDKKFEIAVAVPLVNSSFRFPNRFSATIGSISGTSIPLTSLTTESNTSILHASEVLQAGDRITIKATGGTVGTSLVSSVPTTGASLVSVTDMQATGFATNDTIVGYGTVCPGGWYLANYYAESGYTISITDGHVDGFSAKMYLPALASSGTSRNFYLKQAINTDYYVQNLKYRLGAVYKSTISGAETKNSAFIFGIENNSTSTGNTIFSIASATVSDWTLTTSTFGLTEASPSAFGIYAQLSTDAGYTTKETSLFLDDVFLEHVYDSVTKKTIYGESPSTASTESSYYALTDNHDSESLSITKYDNLTDVSMNDGSLNKYDSTGWGERNVKYELNCTFTMVSNTIWGYLTKLLNIQKNGYKLNLHPFIAELPEVLTGYLTIPSISYEHWDVGLVSFTFNFREA